MRSQASAPSPPPLFLPKSGSTCPGSQPRGTCIPDSIMGEDKSQIRTGNAPHVMANLRNLGLGRAPPDRNPRHPKAMQIAGRNPEIARNLIGL